MSEVNRNNTCNNTCSVNMNNKISLQMDSHSQNESFARTVVAAFITPLDPSVDVMRDIKTAVSEAVTNAIIHGYGKEKGQINLELEIEGEELKITIADSGAGIENIAQAMEPLYTSLPQLERAGIGFTVMEGFMDSVKVKSSPGMGTVVEMVKKIL